jgi:hypothetical protein
MPLSMSAFVFPKFEALSIFSEVGLHINTKQSLNHGEAPAAKKKP